MGILQNPMFGSGTPGGFAVLFPEYGAARVVVEGGFSPNFHAWLELGVALVWLIFVDSLVWLVLRRHLRTS